jgi:hypothetical protein
VNRSQGTGDIHPDTQTDTGYLKPPQQGAKRTSFHDDIDYGAAKVTNSDDLKGVQRASDLLGLAEFDLFREAYRAWHKDIPSDELLEQHFVPYMFSGEAPVWVRSFVRTTLDRVEKGLHLPDFDDRGLAHLLIDTVAYASAALPLPLLARREKAFLWA